MQAALAAEGLRRGRGSAGIESARTASSHLRQQQAALLWIKKSWDPHTMAHSSVVRKSAIMPFAATWVDLEVIIPSEASQTEKDKHHVSLHA